MDALGFDLTGAFDGFDVLFQGEVVATYPTFAGASAGLRLAREALSLLDQTLSERKTV
jgi:hypothetical protein